MSSIKEKTGSGLANARFKTTNHHLTALSKREKQNVAEALWGDRPRQKKKVGKLRDGGCAKWGGTHVAGDRSRKKKKKLAVLKDKGNNVRGRGEECVQREASSLQSRHK